MDIEEAIKNYYRELSAKLEEPISTEDFNNSLTEIIINAESELLEDGTLIQP